MSECVKVMVRARPINQREINEGSKICIETDKKTNQVILTKPSEPSEIPKMFTYDSVYDWNSTQREVYDESAFPLVESVIEGYNGTIFAYGQTGCGKSHTMMGYKDSPEERGIIPNAFEHIFGFIDQSQNSGMKFLVRCSYLEIYNEDVRDLLGRNVDLKLELKEDPNKGVFVKDLTCCIVKSIAEIEKLMHQGTGNRKTGETAMNKDSSRSHSIFTIYIETSEEDELGQSRIKAGKLNLVDLAGSERQSKTQAVGIRLKEATKINLSLSALGNVISALVDGKAHHIPYRDSKLTRLLQDSLGGNTKTVMIAAISPSDFNYDETLSTLRYASRAKAIKNKPRVNEDPKDALLKQYEDEIRKLKEMLQNSGGGQINLDSEDFQKLMRRPTQEHLMVGGDDETVDQLLEKLARKGKKVKIVNDDGDGDDYGNEDGGPSDSDQFEIKGRKRRGGKGGRQSDGVTGGSIAEEDNEDGENDEEGGDGIYEEIKVGYDNTNQVKGQNGIKVTRKGPSKGGQIQVDKKSNKRTIIRDSQDLTSGQEQKLEHSETISNEQLQKLIKEMEQRYVIGGQALNEQQDKERVQKQRQLQIKLRNERKKQKQLIEEKQKQEEELLLKNQQFSSLQEEVDENRRIVEKLRQKYQQAKTELRDIQEEQEYAKQDLLDTVRDQEREIEFCHEVMKAMLKDHEHQKLRTRAKYDENNGKWVLPAFFIKEREIALPRIRNAQALVQNELDKREMVFDDQPEYEQAMKGNNNNKYSREKNNGRKPAGVVRSERDGIGPSNKGSVLDVRQSRESGYYDASQRSTPLELAQRQAQQQVKQMNKPNKGLPTQYQTMTSISEIEDQQYNKKNVRSNVQLQPLNYKTNGIGSPITNVDDILKSQHLENHPLFNQNQQNLQKKGQLSKIQNAPTTGQIQLNVGGSDTGNGSIQMSIQATVSIDPHQLQRRQQLAPLTNINSQQISPQKIGGKANDINSNPIAKGNVKKNRVYLNSIGSNINNGQHQ